MTLHCLTTRFSHLPMLLLALLALVLPGCGDGVRVLPPSDADPTGYYINTGTTSVDDGAGGTINISDLQAMVHGNRIMMMSVEKELLYDGSITDITGDRFTADFTIYTESGRFLVPTTATASGTITAGSSITGTLTGSGVGSGIFSLLYDDTTSSAVADIARIENEAGVNPTWEAKIGGSVFPYKFVLDNQGVIVHDTVVGNGLFFSCELKGDITPISGSSLYSVNVELTECSSNISNGAYTGLAISRTDSMTDDTLVLAVTKVTTVADERYSLEADFK